MEQKETLLFGRDDHHGRSLVQGKETQKKQEASISYLEDHYRKNLEKFPLYDPDNNRNILEEIQRFPSQQVTIDMIREACGEEFNSVMLKKKSGVELPLWCAFFDCFYRNIKKKHLMEAYNRKDAPSFLLRKIRKSQAHVFFALLHKFDREDVFLPVVDALEKNGKNVHCCSLLNQLIHVYPLLP